MTIQYIYVSFDEQRLRLGHDAGCNDEIEIEKGEEAVSNAVSDHPGGAETRFAAATTKTRTTVLPTRICIQSSVAQSMS